MGYHKKTIFKISVSLILFGSCFLSCSIISIENSTIPDCNQSMYDRKNIYCEPAKSCEIIDTLIDSLKFIEVGSDISKIFNPNDPRDDFRLFRKNDTLIIANKLLRYGGGSIHPVPAYAICKDTLTLFHRGPPGRYRQTLEGGYYGNYFVFIFLVRKECDLTVRVESGVIGKQCLSQRVNIYQVDRHIPSNLWFEIISKLNL